MTHLPAGIIPPLATPFRGDSLDEAGFVSNLQRYNSTDLAGYLALGSNGEGVFLTDDEAVRVIELAAEHRAPGKVLLAGTGRESTHRTIELSCRAARAGAQAVLVVPPSYYRASMTDSALDAHYRAVADASLVPVVLYHVPKFSPVNFSAKLILGLARHPNIAGLKETSGDITLLSQVLKDRPPEFKVYMGTGSLLYLALVLGCDGGILVLADVAPQQCVEIFRLTSAGRHNEARALQLRLIPVNQAITTAHGIPGLKRALDLLGYRGGDPLRPLEPLGVRETEDLRAALVMGGLL